MLSHFFRNLPLQNIRILAGTNKTVILKDNLINQWYLTLDIVFLTSITVVTTDVEMLFRDFGQYFSYNKLPTKSNHALFANGRGVSFSKVWTKHTSYKKSLPSRR